MTLQLVVNIPVPPNTKPNHLTIFALINNNLTLVPEPQGSKPLIPKPTTGHDPEPDLSTSHQLFKAVSAPKNLPPPPPPVATQANREHTIIFTVTNINRIL
jgi:hypothetical protein